MMHIDDMMARFIIVEKNGTAYDKLLGFSEWGDVIYFLRDEPKINTNEYKNANNYHLKNKSFAVFTKDYFLKNRIDITKS